ncbi:ABC transporter permease [Dokdonella immobilis]|uniref:ABC-2 type transport system permease protein n=1 Tax=Dokdonella immobilis TaxID=578942 RepID=A0A1I4VN83_9GAMM|nr:ABC transporter permease [Dokdonella immobilis]SFN02406.1 ABC-2 type transport system permease protein [Dokdonella immobilis]
MNAIRLIAGNDLKRRFAQPFAWILLALTCALLAWQFLVALDAYLRILPKLDAVPNAQGATDLIAIPLLRSLSGLLMLIAPLATMQSLAGERRAHTLPLLLSAGVGNLRIVVGKFLGAFGLVALVVILAVLMPLSLEFGSSLDLGRLAAATLGLLLYAASLTAIGIACSAWTASPALAAAAALILGSLLAMLDMGARFQGVDNALINWLSLSTHLEPFLFGLVASVDIVYFLLLTTLALLLASRRLDTLRTRG